MHITTLPVYSKLADPNDIPDNVAAKLPKGWQLSQHQLETYLALTDQNIDVVINTAMTGDGKSLAAYLPTLLDPNRSAFGMYPTNELARDQRRQFACYNQDFKSRLSFDDLWGAKLGKIVEQYPEFTRRAEALAALLREHQVLLTNPDIFHLMLNYRYHSGVLSSAELPYTLAACYNDFIFDEFHIFNTPQMVSAITAMLFFCATANLSRADRPRFLFSSATPSTVFNDLLRASGLRVRFINGVYSSIPMERYRQVLHAADLHLHRLSEQQNAEQWIEAHLQEIQSHWETGDEPRARGVIIVNSVVEARRIARLLSDRLYDIKIGENTGLTDDERRKQAMEDADLIVGTSTIDVGVDFNISLLIFEVPDSGTFLQRLGRLGRCRRDGAAFTHYEAHALFSGRTPWVYDTFIKKLMERGISDGSTVERPTVLRDAVCEAFPSTTGFYRYIKRWGALQAAHIIVNLEDPKRGGSHTGVATRLRSQYQQALGLKNITSAIGRYRHMLRGKNEPGSPTCENILEEVLTFRGSSPFQVGIWDDSAKPPAFLSYDVFVIAQSSEVCLSDFEPFQTALQERFPNPEDRKTVLAQLRYVIQHKEHPLVLFIDEFWSERERLILRIDRFDPQIQCDQVLLLNGLAIEHPKSEETKLLNAILRKQLFIGYVTRREAAELRRKLRLPSFFPLHQVEDSYGRSYRLAIGQAALLLEAEALWMRNLDEEDAPIIC